MPANPFADSPDAYRRHRPDYPEALYTYLLDRCPGRTLAWDCATGNGQVATRLAADFAAVEATDISPEQLAEAPALANVTYRVAPAGASGLADGSCDLVTVGQALHWFDHDAFARELRRVLRPRTGLFAAWTYALATVEPAYERLMATLYDGTLGAYWSPRRRLVDTGYRDLDLGLTPLDDVPTDLAIARTWSVDALGAYLRTWSAVKAFAKTEGRDPVTPFLADLRAARGDGPLALRWPLALLCGRAG